MKKSEGVLSAKQLSAPANVSFKPDTKSGKMKNVIRYVTGQDPGKRASLKTSCPEK